jgi:signal transduction histidine kinase
MVDVIRSALGEVEDYRRVVVRSVGGAVEGGGLAVQGTAAADLAHLLAELVENALVYSPPDQQVEVSGQADPGREGYVLAVVDWGVGMSPAEMATANRRLNGHESFTVAPSSYLGHYVAGKLAVRHGVSIYLRPTTGTGTTALVQLPPTLLTSDAPLAFSPAPPSLSPPSPAAAPAPSPASPAWPASPVSPPSAWPASPAHGTAEAG